jgi:hypothetical protein
MKAEFTTILLKEFEVSVFTNITKYDGMIS